MMQSVDIPQAPTPPPFPDPQVIIAGGPPDWIAPAAVTALLIIVCGIVLYPLIRAWARRIEGRGQPPAMLDEVQELRDRVAELEQSLSRMHELEDRVDFAERMMTQQAERARLGDGA
jgi:flagellar biosynthesis/type III secretory pathway M-ring protein FliF/YscJ